MTIWFSAVSNNKRHIAVFVPSMRGGGAERVMLTLANNFAGRGHRVDLVLAKAEGPYLPDISENVRLVDLDMPRVLRSLWPLVRYLRRERPDAMLSALNYANVIAILAWKLARVPTRLVVSEHSSLARAPARWASKVTRELMRRLYPKADKVICVSKGIEKDMQRLIGVPASKTETIHNPVDIELIHRQMQAIVDHPWIDATTAPAILAAGRLTDAKDYPTLLRAFARLRERREARLIILGKGEQEAQLKTLADELEISRDVDLVGFQENPYAWMGRCDLYVMSSAWEGLPVALVEAMACGARVVSTDCRTGPDEILESGRWGRLVPVGDVDALSMAMEASLDDKSPPDVQGRAEDFGQDIAIELYIRQLSTFHSKPNA